MTALSVRLSKLTGKSSEYIHPKHLIKKKSLFYFSDFRKDDKILDIGCSTGSYSLKLAQKVSKVIGIDYDKNALKIANRRISDSISDKIEFKFANIEKGIGFPDSFFDRVLILDVIEHLNKRNYILAELKRITKSNGLIYISAPNRETSWKKMKKKVGLFFYDDRDHKIEYTKDELIRLINSKKLEILQFKPIVFDFPLRGLFDLIGGFNLYIYKQLSEWKARYVISKVEESSGFFLILKNIK